MKNRLAQSPKAVNAPRPANQRYGQFAERLALAYLVVHGFFPLPRPRRSPVQVDVLVRRGGLILVVEVKARTSAEKAHLALQSGQARRLAHAARQLAAQHPHCSVRIDTILVYPTWPYITWQKGAVDATQLTTLR